MTSIVFITYEYPPQIGGEAAYTSGLTSALCNLGNDIDITIITTTPEKRQSAERNGNLEIIRLPTRTFPKMFHFRIKAKKVLETLEKKIDIIHNTSDYNGIVIPAPGKKIPVIATIHHPYLQEKKIYRANSNYIDYFKYTLNRNIDYLEFNCRHLCKEADKLIAVSNYTAKSIMAEYGISSNKISVIPNAVDIDKFNPEINGTDIRKKLNLGNEKIILFVGRLDFQKGIEFLISAFSEVIKDFPDVKLIVVGDGPLKNRIKYIIYEHDLSKSVFLMGHATDEDLPKIYAASDLFVVPSLMEGFGIVYIEAMSCGKACIGTSIGGVEDVIVNGYTGILVPPANSDAISQAIKTLLSDESMLKKFGKEGRKWVLKNFTWGKVASQTLRVYSEALSKD